MRRFIFVFLVATLAACQCKKNTVAQPDNTLLIRLETQGCRGFCPVYKVTFRNNGAGEYEGIRSVQKMGAANFALTKEELARLQAEVKKVNLWQYPERIESQVADAPSATLTVFKGEKSHSVSGSIDRPKPILELEDLIKNLTEAHGLRVKEGVDPNAAPANQQELIVHFKPEVNPGNWLLQFQEIRLRLLRRVSSDNIWLIGYNPEQIQENQLIDLLKGMEGVLEVQVNKQAKERN